MKLKHLLVFGLISVLFFSVFRPVQAATKTQKTAATVKTAGKISITPSPAPTAAPAKVEYFLPYPGLLPDHPLYFIKKIRDQILEALIVDPVRKAEFYLLQADKQLNMSIGLTEKGNGQLAVEVLVQSGKYFEKAVGSLTMQKSLGQAIAPHVLEKLEKSSMKHLEEMEILTAKIGESQKSAVSAASNLIKKLQSEIANLK